MAFVQRYSAHVEFQTDTSVWKISRPIHRSGKFPDRYIDLENFQTDTSIWNSPDMTNFEYIGFFCFSVFSDLARANTNWNSGDWGQQLGASGSCGFWMPGCIM